VIVASAQTRLNSEDTGMHAQQSMNNLSVSFRIAGKGWGASTTKRQTVHSSFNSECECFPVMCCCRRIRMSTSHQKHISIAHDSNGQFYMVNIGVLSKKVDRLSVDEIAEL